MSALIPFVTLDQTCEQVQDWVSQQLINAGFRVVQTFDLQMARLAHPDCPCPHHGTDDCNCQMIVLLVYRKQGEPATLIIHGQDKRAWLSLADSVGKHTNQRLEVTIRHTLMRRISNLPLPVEVVYETQSTI